MTLIRIRRHHNQHSWETLSFDLELSLQLYCSYITVLLYSEKSTREQEIYTLEFSSFLIGKV